MPLLGMKKWATTEKLPIIVVEICLHMPQILFMFSGGIIFYLHFS